MVDAMCPFANATKLNDVQESNNQGIVSWLFHSIKLKKDKRLFNLLG